jgi:hypothetical protein
VPSLLKPCVINCSKSRKSANPLMH